MLSRARAFVAYSLGFAILGGIAAAQEPTPKPQPVPERPKPKPTPGDNATFIEKANAGDLMEIALGQLASTQSENSDVKDFAQKMVRDHERMRSELNDLAGRKQITLQNKLPDGDQKVVDEIGKLKGKAFDERFMKRMVTDHEKAVNLFKTHSTDDTDTTIKEFAAKGLPTLEEHLKEAKSVRDKVISGKKEEKPKKDKAEKPVPDRP